MRERPALKEAMEAAVALREEDQEERRRRPEDGLNDGENRCREEVVGTEMVVEVMRAEVVTERMRAEVVAERKRAEVMAEIKRAEVLVKRELSREKKRKWED